MITLTFTEKDFGRSLCYTIEVVPKLSWTRARMSLCLRLLEIAFRMCGFKTIREYIKK